MREYKISFWKRALTHPDEFIGDNTEFVTTAIIMESKDNLSEIFHVKLTDIGLHSQFGEFDIIKTNNRWQTVDFDGTELNFLKSNIIWSLDSLLK